METNEISYHQVRLHTALSAMGRWATAKELAAASGVAERTVRAHLLRWSKVGIVDQVELFPGHRYRLSPMANKRNGGLLARLQRAGEILGGG